MFLSSVATRSFCLQRILRKVLWVWKVDHVLWGLIIRRSFPLKLSTYGKLILILISFSFWISVACVCCRDWEKLWLLVNLWKNLLIMLLRCPFSFNNCFILAFSLVKLFLFVIMEYALLKKEERKLSLFGRESCSVVTGQYM